MTANSLVQRVQHWQLSLAENRVIRFGLLMAIAISMLSAGWKLWASSELSIEQLAGPLAVAMVVATTHRFVNAYGWVLALRAMRLRVDGLAATRVWLTAESRRWLPGGIWGYASRATMANRLGVNSVTATASMMLELLLVLFASASVAAWGVMVYGRQLDIHLEVLQHDHVAAFAAVGLIALALACWFCRPRLFAKLRGMQYRYRCLQGMQLSISGTSMAGLFFVAMNLLGGLITVVLMPAVPGGDSVPILAVLAASSAAWCVGFFAFLSPGGLLVREAALAALLVPWLPYTDGLALAVLTRLAQLIAEAIAISWLALTKPNDITTSAAARHVSTSGQYETRSDRMLAT